MTQTNWLQDLTGKQKSIIGMVHLPALPGTPLYDATGGMKAIRDWVGSYVSIFYPDDGAVQHDTSLQRWSRRRPRKSSGRPSSLTHWRMGSTRSHAAGILSTTP